MNSYIERINFGKYLEDIRTKHGISVDELSEGLCDRSLITRIESGERFSSMLLRDRLIDRIGATSEEYEKYVKVEEFKRWKSRREIVCDIENDRYTEANTKLARYYDSIIDHDPLEEQFFFDMKAMLAKHEGDENEHAYAEQALKKTVNLDDAGFVVTHRLAPREINLVIEYSAGLDKKKRQEQLCQLLRYADNNRIDGRNLVLYYPKLVCVYVSEFIDDNKENPEWLSWTLRMVHRAAKCLLDTHRLIYALELTEIKDLIWNNILDLEDCENALGYDLFLENKKKNAEEHDLWLDLGRIYGIEIRTIDWCYLYREEGVKCIGDIIRRRRKMIGMSKEELCMDICSFDTLERIEKLRVNPQPKRMLKLLERLNLAGEYQKTLVSVAGAKAKMCEERITRFSNRREYDKALREIENLESVNKNPTPEDKQFLFLNKSMMNFRKRLIPAEECERFLYKALAYTLTDYDVSGDYYMTRLELTCLYNIVMLRKGLVDDELAHFIEGVCSSQLLNDNEFDIRIMELLLLAVITIKETKKEWDEAERYSRFLVSLELQYKRSISLYYVFNEKIRIYKEKLEWGENIQMEEIKQNARFVRIFRSMINQDD